MASNNEVILEEIEALEAIMMDEVNVHYNQSGQPNAVQVTVKPATAQNIEQQHVRVTLIVSLPPGYPDEPPTISLRNPRGIDDDVLELVKAESIKKCEEYLGLPVIYELIELVREKLTANNTPSCPCAICLFHFTDNDHFTKTPCFHYFHSNCLGRYILNCEETAAADEKENQQPVWMTREKWQLLCPVCRESLHEEISGTNLLENPPPEEGELMKDFNPTSPEIKALQEKMMSLYLHQKSKGGIIDLEEEKNKFLISAAVNNLESLEREPSVEDTMEGTRFPPNKEVPTKQTSSKGGPQRHTPNNVKRGGGGGGGGGGKGSHNQGKRDYSNNGWWGGNKSRSNKKGNRVANAGRQNYYYSDPSHKLVDSPQMFEEGFHSKKTTRNERERQGRYTPRNPEPSKGYDAKYPPSADIRLDETNKKSGRTHFYRNSHHRGGGGGGGAGSSKGMPPPGFSELERNVRSHTTS